MTIPDKNTGAADIGGALVEIVSLVGPNDTELTAPAVIDGNTRKRIILANPTTGVPLDLLNGGIGGAVSSVNGKTGTVVLAATDLSMTGTPSNSTFARGDNSWATPAGGGTVTNAADLTSNSVVLGTGTTGVKVAAGFTTDGTSKLTLGAAGSSVGAVAMTNATSGSITVRPPTGALGSATLTLPAATDTLVGRATTDTLSNKTLTAPVLGTPASGTLTNCTGLPVAGVAGLGTGVGTFLATPSSANLAAAVTNETGSGSLVFATSPTLVTPLLGTPTSGTLTNCTGLPISTGVSGLGASVGAFLATASSANLAAAVTDETGSGALVFGTSPTLTTPTVSSPSTKFARPAANNTGVGSSISGYNAGASISQWQPVYMGGAGTWLLADADGSGTRQCRGLALAAGTNGNPMDVLDNGIARNDSWTWTPGGDVYLTTTAGVLSQTPPASSADVRRVGYALSATEMRVAIDSFYVTV